MQIQIDIPDDVAHSLESKWGSLEQKLLEMLASAAYQEGSISAGKVRELLGMATRLEVDVFLKDKGVYLHYNEADFEQDMLTMRRLEQKG
jgi:predicted HTH domain antitoxin